MPRGTARLRGDVDEDEQAELLRQERGELDASQFVDAEVGAGFTQPEMVPVVEDGAEEEGEEEDEDEEEQGQGQQGQQQQPNTSSGASRRKPFAGDRTTPASLLSCLQGD
jgi:hypothetical protein